MATPMWKRCPEILWLAIPAAREPSLLRPQIPGFAHLVPEEWTKIGFPLYHEVKYCLNKADTLSCLPQGHIGTTPQSVSLGFFYVDEHHGGVAGAEIVS